MEITSRDGVSRDSRTPTDPWDPGAGTVLYKSLISSLSLGALCSTFSICSHCLVYTRISYNRVLTSPTSVTLTGRYGLIRGSVDFFAPKPRKQTRKHLTF